MRQWWNKLPLYDREGRGSAPLVVIKGGFGKQKPHQEDPDDDDDPPITPKKKGQKVETEEVTINGKKYTVPKGMGEEINKLSGGKGAKIDASGLQQVRQMFEELLDQRVGKPKKAKKEPEPDDDDEGEDDTLMFTDPAKWKKQFAEKIRKEITTEITKSYRSDQSQKDFWRGFYDKNEDLEAYDFIVKAVLQENIGELGEMETKAGLKKLAELTREKLIEIGRKATGKKGKSKDADSYVEGSGTARRGRDNDDDDDLTDQDEEDRKNGMPMTLGAALKARREQRRKRMSSTAEE